MKKTFLIVAFIVMLASCAGVQLHPGSANAADSAAYDALRDAQAVIDTARPQFASGALSANLKPLFNKLIAAYDIATPVWKTYHDAALTGKNPDIAVLNKDLADLAKALSAFRSGK